MPFHPRVVSIGNGEMQKPGIAPCALVFDIGGVLVDWNPRYLYRALIPGDPRAMDEFFNEIDFWNWNDELDRGRPFAEAVADRCARFPHYAGLIRAFDERWEETLGGPIEGGPRLVHGLREAGFPLFGLTNSSPEKFGIVRKKFPFLESFEWIMISGEFGLLKPDPRMFDVFLKRSGLKKGDCFFIDDTEANVAAAVRAGWKAIRFRSTDQITAELEIRGIRTGPLNEPTA
jgi:2-haloacid dehalogenase